MGAACADAAAVAAWRQATATCLREVMNAILYIASSGRQWRMLPKDFPPVSTVRGYVYDWRDRALLATINDVLVMSARDLEGRGASPTAGVHR